MTQQQIDNLPEAVRIDGEADTRNVYCDGDYLSPTRSQKVRNHSPDGFNWGYGGSGPAQLALAILLKYLPENEAVKRYQAFKWKFVGTWPQAQDFEVTINLREFVRSNP